MYAIRKKGTNHYLDTTTGNYGSFKKATLANTKEGIFEEASEILLADEELVEVTWALRWVDANGNPVADALCPWVPKDIFSKPNKANAHRFASAAAARREAGSWYWIRHRSPGWRVVRLVKRV